MCGSLRSGDMSLREGRDSSRPRLYLRSVATSATLPLTTIHCPLPSTFLHFYTAIFATARRRRYGCDRMFGSLRSGDMSPRAGRDSSRPRLSPPLGRNKCDPPANHHSLPTAIYISTLLHGHFYDGEAPSLRVSLLARAPSLRLRPHVRLTSLGGYVATGVGIAVAARPAAWHVATAPSPSQARLLLRMMPVMVYYAAKGDEHD